jgi:hypothetical protein
MVGNDLGGRPEAEAKIPEVVKVNNYHIFLQGKKMFGIKIALSTYCFGNRGTLRSFSLYQLNPSKRFF